MQTTIKIGVYTWLLRNIFFKLGNLFLQLFLLVLQLSDLRAQLPRSEVGVTGLVDLLVSRLEIRLFFCFSMFVRCRVRRCCHLYFVYSQGYEFKHMRRLVVCVILPLASSCVLFFHALKKTNTTKRLERGPTDARHPRATREGKKKKTSQAQRKSQPQRNHSSQSLGYHTIYEALPICPKLSLSPFHSRSTSVRQGRPASQLACRPRRRQNMMRNEETRGGECSFRRPRCTITSFAADTRGRESR